MLSTTEPYAFRRRFTISNAITSYWRHVVFGDRFPRGRVSVRSRSPRCEKREKKRTSRSLDRVSADPRGRVATISWVGRTSGGRREHAPERRSSPTVLPLCPAKPRRSSDLVIRRSYGTAGGPVGIRENRSLFCPRCTSRKPETGYHYRRCVAKPTCAVGPPPLEPAGGAGE